jgi:hypothetical protein
MENNIITPRRPASARPRPPAAKEEPKAPPEEREDDGLGIADDVETWCLILVIHTCLVSSCRIESVREHLDDVILPSAGSFPCVTL